MGNGVTHDHDGNNLKIKLGNSLDELVVRQLTA